MIVESVAILVSLGFVISVIYDWGFFYSLGLDYTSVPTTIQDHFRTGIVWLPYLFAFIFMSFAIEFQFQRVERGLSEKEIIDNSPNPEKTKKFREGPWKLIKWIAPLAVFNYILVGDIISSILPLMLSVIWMSFAEWCYSAPLIRFRRSWEAQTAFTFLPIIFIFAFFSGYNTAIDNAKREPTKVVVQRSQPLPSIKGNLLRELERGVLILADDGHISFIPWAQVGVIDNQEKYKPFRGILCEWLHHCEELPSNKSIRPTAKSGG